MTSESCGFHQSRGDREERNSKGKGVYVGILLFLQDGVRLIPVALGFLEDDAFFALTPHCLSIELLVSAMLAYAPGLGRGMGQRRGGEVWCRGATGEKRRGEKCHPGLAGRRAPSLSLHTRRPALESEDGPGTRPLWISDATVLLPCFGLEFD